MVEVLTFESGAGGQELGLVIVEILCFSNERMALHCISVEIGKLKHTLGLIVTLCRVANALGWLICLW